MSLRLPPATAAPRSAPSTPKQPVKQTPVEAKYADGFETGTGAEKVKRLMTQELGRKLLQSPLFKQLPKGARAALEQVLPHLSEPAAVVALMKQLKSEWFQKLSPADQEKSFKSLVSEVTPAGVKKLVQLERFR